MSSFKSQISKKFRTFTYNSEDEKASSRESLKSAEPTEEIEPELPPLAPLNLIGYNPQTKHRLLTPQLAQEIRNLVSQRLQLYSDWNLLYSLEQHGASLSTLYTRCSPDFMKDSNNIHSLNQQYNYSTVTHQYTNNHVKKTGYILVVKDFHGNIFGAFANEHFHPGDHRFYGNGECFLWRTKKGSILEMSHDSMTSQHVEHRLGDDDQIFQAFPYTGLNNFIIHCTKNFLSMGVSEGHYGLWLDSALLNGVSFRTLTFGNEPLAENEKFKVAGVEVWRIG